MNTHNIFLPEQSPALNYAAKVLTGHGCRICSQMSEADCILLPVPGTITADFWNTLPEDVPIVGGNLPADHHLTYDLLKDAHYLAKNAMITARCALSLAAEKLPLTVDDWEVLVIGHGRIGICLADILKKNGAEVAVCSGKEKSRAICQALGYSAIAPEDLPDVLSQYRVVFNTAPAPMLADCKKARENALLIDLASVPGILDKRVIWARGLPGKMAPESSGTLIAQSILRILAGKE